MNKLKQELKAECKLQEKLIQRYEKEIKKLPEGSLSKKTRGNQIYYYYQYKTPEGNFRQRLIKEKETQLIQQLKRKKFLAEALKMMPKNVKLMKSCYSQWEDYQPNEILKILPDTYREIPMSCYLDTHSKNAKQWLNINNDGDIKYPENKIHLTISGDFVRSKSEAIIAGLLESENIPYKYESELQLGDTAVHPDFTVLRECDNEEIYWEHFGLMDNPQYLENAIKKILLYRKYGINPSNKFIMTFDSSDGGIDVKELQDIIRLKLKG